jgi:hypothetical protein
MKTLLTNFKKALLSVLFISLFFANSVFAQGILPPDDENDLPDLPFVFNVDTEDIDWDGYTMYPFDGAGLIRLENPSQSGVNTTQYVIEYKKGGAGEGGQPWAGFFYHTDGPFDITDESVFRLKVWSPRSGINALLKLEMREFSDVTTGDLLIPIETANQWVQLEWDLSGVDQNTPYDKVVIIMDLEGGAGDAGDNHTWYLDDFEFISQTSTSTERNNNEIPSTINLGQNYPNPFNPTTNITFGLPQSGFATLEVFNMIGQSIAVLVNENLSAGQHTVSFDASNLSSGVYVYRLKVGNEVVSRQMTLVK